jgi:hypothetical protein
MKKIFLTSIIIIFSAQILFAQQNFSSSTTKKNDRNEIKVNLFAFAFKSVSIQYERQISRKTTVEVTFRTMPKSTLPFKNIFKNAISDTSTSNQLDNFKTGNLAIMPSIRFYVGHKGAYHGFYIAPFVAYTHYTGSLPYKYYDGDYKTIPLSGSMNTFTGGFMLGAQWNLSKSVYLDWWILGPHYGISKGSASGKQSLSLTEQDALKYELDNLNIPFTKTTNMVDANGATVYFSGPWAGIRSGLSLGIRF